jgi:ubiquinone/menaquinone biosynthesis C-methylase UbiE
MSEDIAAMDSENVKSCCTKFYENDLISSVLGDNFHPGGEKITQILGEKLGLNEDSLVLDIACGPGASAIILSRLFGCKVIGIDLSEKNLNKAREFSRSLDLSDKLEFKLADAENLDFIDETFDAVVCECALCTFPNKKKSVSEMYRVLKNGGRVGITDVILEGELPPSFNDMLSYVLCISGALPVDEYKDLFQKNAFSNIMYEDHTYAIRDLVDMANKLLPAIGIIEKFCGCSLESSLGITREKAKTMIADAYNCLDSGKLGYGLFTGVKI